MTVLKRHIVHLINYLDYGGGLERKLARLVREFPSDHARHTVLAFAEPKGFCPEFNDCANVTTNAMGLSEEGSYLSRMTKRVLPVIRELKKMGQIDLVHSWSYPGHVLLAPIRLALPRIKGRVLAMDLNNMVRPVREDSFQFRLGTKMIRPIAARDSSRVISISPEMTRGLLARSFRPDNILDITNGVSSGYFMPQPGAVACVKDELHLNHVRHLVGIASRHGSSENEVYKDVPAFVHAMAELKAMNPELFRQCGFVMCGVGTNNGDLQQLAHQLGVSENLRTLGLRTDMPRLYSSWTLSNVCSRSEPFGLVVPEAMACETPCVVTDTSLFPEMVGDTGAIVPVGDPKARAHAWEKLLHLPQEQYEALGQAARARVLERYSHDVMVGRYVDMYQELAGSRLKRAFGY